MSSSTSTEALSGLLNGLAVAKMHQAQYEEAESYLQEVGGWMRERVREHVMSCDSSHWEDVTRGRGRLSCGTCDRIYFVPSSPLPICHKILFTHPVVPFY
jgi:hypothetical protein